MALKVHEKCMVVESSDQSKIWSVEQLVHKAEQITLWHKSLETYFKIVG